MTRTFATGPGDDAKAIEAEIKRLQERLASALAANNKKSTAPGRIHLAYSPTGKSLVIDCNGVTDSRALAAVLRDLGERQFGKESVQVADKSGKITISGKVSVQVADESGKITISGSKEYLEWVAALVKGMAGPPR